MRIKCSVCRRIKEVPSVLTRRNTIPICCSCNRIGREENDSGGMNRLTKIDREKINVEVLRTVTY